MSKATKRKHVAKEVLEDYYIPEGEEEIVKILGGRGNNLHEVENAFGKHYLVSMPTKFRKNIWVKRGDYVVIVPIKEGNKVQGEIDYILLAKQIKYLKNENLWPKEFDVEPEIKGEREAEPIEESKPQEITVNGKDDDIDSEESSDDDELFENPNHRHFCYEDSSEEESSEYEEDDGEEDGEDCCDNDTELESQIKKVSLE